MENKNHILEVTILPGVDTIVIKKEVDDLFFKTTKNSILISRRSLIALVNFLVKNDIIDYRVLEGILEEYNSLNY